MVYPTSTCDHDAVANVQVRLDGVPTNARDQGLTGLDLRPNVRFTA